ncbi:MAG TPA: acyl-CoA dehydrogenase family protein [Trebonia sp.]|jgi:alkylation response protein AidB-like acyl-CoA dehydrogenase|nr:acyl-CoA dehydrogenase family protein [Trebonia sp.]
MTEAESTEQFRQRLRSFLEANHPGRGPKGSRQERTRWQQAWAAALFDHGFAGPAWPQKYGGCDLDLDKQAVYYEEIAGARVPGHPGNGPNIAGPTIIRFGTEQQRDRFLRPMLRGDVVWAQGFSEPEAGSDLPALRTTARRERDEYVINGQKVWSSNADVADWLYALVRTGTQQSRSAGITYLLIDLTTPGITLRPIRDMSGGTHFCEIFFDEVRVPVANRIGEEDKGWGVARTSLGHERATRALSQAALFRRVWDELVSLLKERGALADEVARDRVAQLEIRVRIMQLTAQRTIGEIRRTGEPGAASSTSRLYQSLLEQNLYELAMELLGPDALLLDPASGAVQGGRWVRNYLRSRAATIGTGTAEIQRNTIAERVLGLPQIFGKAG